ncbi:hypothetical protein EV663_10623 [Rhodovulum bhavnagarense]|uniref:Uncharacterized protein n=1 Tax=Rhodovulum bhavnagarense TaxID=992286 RepID=A0A4R2RG71_9RHOB|nr:hypothetical protein [Rhodovulum bhavnagarense]TCP61077.1 hypothetical protein EV663_10623 [Rhodovulum bhavnagarense]
MPPIPPDIAKLYENSHDMTGLDDTGRSLLANIRFCDMRIWQLNNEWAVADTARTAYMAALRREMGMSDE